MASGAESYNFNGLVMPHVPAEVLQLKATLNQTLAPSAPTAPRARSRLRPSGFDLILCPRVSWPSGYTEAVFRGGRRRCCASDPGRS